MYEEQGKRTRHSGPPVWMLLALLAPLLFSSCSKGGDPAASGCEKNKTATLVMESKSSESYDVLLDGRKIANVPAHGAVNKEVDSGSHTVTYKYAGSGNVACSGKTVLLPTCEVVNTSCDRQGGQQPTTGEIVAANRSSSGYKLFVDNAYYATLTSGQTHTVTVNPGDHDVTFRFADNDHVACAVSRNVAAGGRADAICSVELYYTRNINGAGAHDLCPAHTGGDREFGGHGPDVWADANLAIINQSVSSLVENLHLHAKETRSDWTEAEGRWSYTIWSAPRGHQIVEILSSKHSDTYYRDTNHQLDYPPVGGGNLVSRFEIMGDTGGNDVGNCTRDDVYMNVFLNEIRIKVKR